MKREIERSNPGTRWWEKFLNNHGLRRPREESPDEWIKAVEEAEHDSDLEEIDPDEDRESSGPNW